MRLDIRIALVVAGALACHPVEERERPATPGASAAIDTAEAEPDVFTERVAVFLLADSTHLARMRQEHGDDAEVVFDDMMWYRAEAWDWIEQNGIPVVSTDGRPTLRFRVAGVDRAFDYTSESGGDLVVLYDTDREPLAVAPIDVVERGGTYFLGLPRKNDR